MIRITRASLVRGAALAAALLLTRSVAAQVAAPGDVYYKVHIDQAYKYYAFVNDVVTWENADHAGTVLSVTASHDTSDVSGSVGTLASVSADAGHFALDLDTHMVLSARTGLFHVMTNRVRLDVYVRGPAGTPYWMNLEAVGAASASRLGGLPGTLQPVNGLSSASFLDSTAMVDYTGSIQKPVQISRWISGATTGSTVVVGPDTYSFAGSFIFGAPATATQAVCILGCMTAPADFNTLGAGHIDLNVYPYVDPAGVPAAPPRTTALSVQASPNPVRRSTNVSFRAPAGAPARVSVFDVRGRRVATLHDGVATGAPQSLAWDARGAGAGLYFVRVESAGQVATAKLTRLE